MIILSIEVFELSILLLSILFVCLAIFGTRAINEALEAKKGKNHEAQEASIIENSKKKVEILQKVNEIHESILKDELLANDISVLIKRIEKLERSNFLLMRQMHIAKRVNRKYDHILGTELLSMETPWIESKDIKIGLRAHVEEVAQNTVPKFEKITKQRYAI